MAKVFLFPGQGSQFVGMGKSLFQQYKTVRDTFEEASDFINIDMAKLCFDTDISELTMTENAQPAIVTVGVATYRVYMEEIGVKPDYLIGHSLGELTALGCSGAIKFEDLINIVKERGKLMQNKIACGDGTMSAIIGMEQDDIEEVCETFRDMGINVEISNYNLSNQVVISGLKNDVDEVANYLKKEGAKILPLKVSAPFHSSYMKPASEVFSQVLDKYTYYDMDKCVVSTVTSKPYGNKRDIIPTLKEQLYKPVLWKQSIDYLIKNDMNLAIDFGPKSIVKKLIEDEKNQVTSIAISDLDKILELKRYMAN